MPCACANGFPCFLRGRKGVAIHGNDHGNKDNRVVKEMEFDSGNNQLQDAGWYRGPKQIVVKSRLSDEEQMLNVVPKLNDKRDCPPFPGLADKAPSQHPNSYQHYERISIVQHLRIYQPWIPQPKNAASSWSWPMKKVNLHSLSEMLGPMPQHNNHENPEGAFVPPSVQLGQYAVLICRGRRNLLKYLISCNHK
jgi:hypothetical protein